MDSHDIEAYARILLLCAMGGRTQPAPIQRRRKSPTPVFTTPHYGTRSSNGISKSKRTSNSSSGSPSSRGSRKSIRRRSFSLSSGNESPGGRRYPQIIRSPGAAAVAAACGDASVITSKHPYRPISTAVAAAATTPAAASSLKQRASRSPGNKSPRIILRMGPKPVKKPRITLHVKSRA